MLHSLCAVPIWPTHAGDDTVDWQASESVVDGLVHSPGISSRAAPWWLPLTPDKSWVLLFGDVDVKARVRGPHDVAGTRVQQDVGGVQSAYSDQTYSIPAGEETRSAPNRAGWCVLTCLGFLTLWLTFCEHERRQRWNSCPGIPQRICFHPGGCDAPRWQSSGGRFGAIGPLNTRRPPWKRKRGLIGHVGERLTFKSCNTNHQAQRRGHVRRFYIQGCRCDVLHLPVELINTSITGCFWTIGTRCTHPQLSGRHSSRGNMALAAKAKEVITGSKGVWGQRECGWPATKKPLYKQVL